MISKFWIEEKDGDEEHLSFYVGTKLVGDASHDEHGWAGMKSMADLFESTAKALGAKFERR